MYQVNTQLYFPSLHNIAFSILSFELLSSGNGSLGLFLAFYVQMSNILVEKLTMESCTTINRMHLFQLKLPNFQAEINALKLLYECLAFILIFGRTAAASPTNANVANIVSDEVTPLVGVVKA